MARGDKSCGEIELKFDLDPAATRIVEGHPLLAGSDPQRQRQLSTYFDTIDGELKRLGYSLRVRESADGFTQTLKTRSNHAGLFDRREWETRVLSTKPEPRALARAPLAELGDDPLFVVVARTQVERTSWLINHRGSAILVCLDKGAVGDEDPEQLFHELELELRHGEPADLFAVARTLLEAVPLRLGVLSKDERSEILQQGTGRPWIASKIMLGDGVTTGAVFLQAVQLCVRDFRLNEASVVADHHPEALHQARIAMRRLRSALNFFGPAIRRSSLWLLRTELRWLTASLAKARDLDVFLAQHARLSQAHRRKLRLARLSAYEQANAAIDSHRLRRFLFDLTEWLLISKWQKKNASLPISSFARKRLDPLWKEVQRRSRHLADLDDEGLHRLRISIKELRYAVEFLETLYGKRARKFSSQLEAVQDRLGSLNDDAVGRTLVKELSLGTNNAGPEAIRAPQLKELQALFRKLRKADRFWNDESLIG